MRSLMTLLLSTSVATLGLGQDAGPETARDAKAEGPAVIDVKRTRPVEVVYLDHAGPYWSLGSPFREVRKYMMANDQAGPMFARFLDDPTGVAAREIRSEVGFIVSGVHQPTPPFKKSRRDAELVAYMTVGVNASPARSYAVLRVWIATNGYVALGPVTELYGSIERGKIRHQQTEIQMPIRSAAATHDEGEPPGVRRSSEPSGRTDASDKTDRDVALQGVSEPTGVPGGPDPATDRGSGTDATGESSDAEPGAGAIERRLRVPVKELIAAREFERVAEQLLPAPEAIPQASRLWLGQLVFRISAAAKGVKHTYPSEGKDVVELGETIARRYKKISAGFQADPLAQAVVTVDARTDPHATKRQEIMRDMDALLGRIALKTVGAEEAQAQLGAVLQQAQDLLAAAEGSGIEGTP